MPFLFSNFPPTRTNFQSYPDAFRDLIKKCDELYIATGYISTDSLVDLASIIEINKRPKLELCIGMHYFDGLTPNQHEALLRLNEVLTNNDLGSIYMTVTFPFHGKIVHFSEKNISIGLIIGSSNLSNIVVGGPRQYEADYLFEGQSNEANDAKLFITDLINTSSKRLDDIKVKIVTEHNDLLNDQYGVAAATDNEKDSAKHSLGTPVFELPVKADETPGSNINKHFGKGRENIQGFVTPRSWYEVELIVPKTITSLPGYPQADAYGEGGVFNVITDDGWKFQCKVSGTNSKNICSDGDMKILGKWLKGRLERAGILKPGEKVTDEMLNKYGRNTITMSKLNDIENTWFFDFGVEE